eukprot:10309373-Lingulodinium_polyedra.AAC.1
MGPGARRCQTCTSPPSGAASTMGKPAQGSGPRTSPCSPGRKWRTGLTRSFPAPCRPAKTANG